MAATVHSRIVDLDELIPRPADTKREDKDVQDLIPWVFQEHNVARMDCMQDWSRDDGRFKGLFADLPTYGARIRTWRMTEGRDACSTRMTENLQPTAVVTIPQQNWSVSGQQVMGRLLQYQRPMLINLIASVYMELEDVAIQLPRLRFPPISSRMKYYIGKKEYGAIPQGRVIVNLWDYALPILSYTAWWEGQTWNEFIGETLTIMIGQLSESLRMLGVNGEEVFVVGFHGKNFHIARGFFSRELITRAYLKGCSPADEVELHFSRGYNLCLKEDWMEATRALSRLIRYLLSGEAKLTALGSFLRGRHYAHAA
ncbi:hypothetical protein BDV25DRAFT_138440 [Aspergillus avenaceus]|uniref:Uncharacterized protein n=1 Tax=Aspergillus avenaceus TaxID=36643 RepID=A0A5N6TZP9_ASPAV|nr:hypothetical protein BDV25DRAFT_138440 [Aspergillus avenaceus]